WTRLQPSHGALQQLQAPVQPLHRRLQKMQKALPTPPPQLLSFKLAAPPLRPPPPTPKFDQLSHPPPPPAPRNLPHPRRNTHGSNRFTGDVARIEDEELAGVTLVVVAEHQHAAVVFGGVRRARHEERFADAVPRSERTHLAGAAFQVVLVDRGKGRSLIL